MIYEMRTYTLKTGATRDFLERFAAGYPAREKYSRLGGMWTTDIGQLSQAVHIWPYESLQHRADVRAESAKDASGKWPPKTADLILTAESDILDGVANMKPWGEPQQWGSVYEMRVYTYAPGDIGKAAAAFNEALPGRDAIYPVAGMFSTSQGHLNRLIQLFPYKSWDHREEVRGEFRKSGVWPPHAEVRPINQYVVFMEPASFSPIH